MFEKLLRHLFVEKINGRKYKAGGLLPHKEDARDFEYAKLGGIFGGYTPKHDTWSLASMSVKDQSPFNDCVFNSLTCQREIDEKKVLSVKSVVCYARQHGLLAQDGLSDLRNGQKAGILFGMCEESILPDIKMDWDTYSSASNLTDTVVQNASQYKSKTYFIVKSKDDWLKALDDGHPIVCGLDWYSSYNMSGGLGAPWILPWMKGVKVGGHAVCAIGYDIQNQLIKIQNSYGKDWGDNGCFYVRFSDWFRYQNLGYIAVELDPPSLAQFITQYEGKQVKSANSPVIYLIQNGQKCAFPDEITFYAFGGRFGEQQTWQLVSQTLLDQIPLGEPMNILASPVWPILKADWDTLKWLKSPDNFQMVDQLVQEFGKGNTK